MAELERMYISQDRERRGEEDDGGLGRGENREARLSIRLEMSHDSLLSRQRAIHAPNARCLGFHIKLLCHVCVVLRFKDLSLSSL